MPNDIRIRLLLDGKDAISQLGHVDSAVDEIARSVGHIGDSFRSASAAIKTNFMQQIGDARIALQGIREIGWAFRDVFARPIQLYVEREQAETAFEVLLGSAEAASERMAELVDFAAKTPFQLGEVVEASRMLQGMTDGALATGDALRMVGDVSSGTGKNIGELAMHFGRLYNAAMTGTAMGESLLVLTQLGAISGDTRIKLEELQAAGASGDEIWGLLTESFSRYSGLMEKQSATLGGKISNLQDSFDSARVSVGGMIGGALAPLITVFSDGIQRMNEFSPALTAVIGTVISAGAAFMALQVTGIMPFLINLPMLSQALGMARVQFALASMGGQTFSGALTAAGIAAKGFFASLGPIGWAVLGITALAAAFSLLGDSTDAATEAAEQYATQARVEKAVIEEKIKAIGNENTSNAERKRLIEEVQRVYPSFLSDLDLEKASHDAITTALKKENAALETNTLLKIKNKQYEAVLEKIDTYDYTPSWWDTLWASAVNNMGVTGTVAPTPDTDGYTALLSEKAKIEKEMADLRAQLNVDVKAEVTPSATTTGSGSGTRDLIDDMMKLRDRKLEILRLEGKITERYAEGRAYLNEVNDLLNGTKITDEQRLNLLRARLELEKEFTAITGEAAELSELQIPPAVKIAESLDLVKTEAKEINLVFGETEIALERIAGKIGTDLTVSMNNFISSATLGMMNFADIAEAVKDGWRAAASAVANAGSSAIRVFSRANSLLEIFVNELAKAIVQALIFKAVMKVLDFLPFSAGGAVTAQPAGHASGGYITGAGGDTDDLIPAMLSNGEYVVNARSTRAWLPLLEKINSQQLPHFANGGAIGIPISAMSSGSINITLDPVEFRQRGSDLRAVVNAVEKKLRRR